MNEMRKLMEAVKGANVSMRTLAFYHVDDYGRQEEDLPFIIVTVENSGDEKADVQRARELGVEAGVPDMKTGFLMPHPYDDLLDQYEASRRKTNKIQKVLRAVSKTKLNQVKIFRDN